MKSAAWKATKASVEVGFNKRLNYLQTTKKLPFAFVATICTYTNKINREHSYIEIYLIPICLRGLSITTRNRNQLGSNLCIMVSSKKDLLLFWLYNLGLCLYNKKHMNFYYSRSTTTSSTKLSLPKRPKNDSIRSLFAHLTPEENLATSKLQFFCNRWANSHSKKACIVLGNCGHRK